MVNTAGPAIAMIGLISARNWERPTLQGSLCTTARACQATTSTASLATTEASAAPSSPQLKVNMNSGSSTALTSEPNTVAHMERRASPMARTAVAALIPNTSIGILGSRIPA